MIFVGENEQENELELSDTGSLAPFDCHVRNTLRLLLLLVPRSNPLFNHKDRCFDNEFLYTEWSKFN